MAERRPKASARREPERAANLDLRLQPQDRVGGGDGPPRQRKRAAGGRTASRKRRAGGGGGRRLFGRLIYWGLVAAVWMVIAGGGAVVWISAHLPAIESLEIPKRPPSIQIAGLDGRVLVTRGDMGGAAVPLKELPPHLPKAFVAIEDRRFYSHFGVDAMGIARAATANVLRRGVAQGGSTLTQQLAKNLFLTQERTLHRKAQEVVLALWLERKYSKAQILDLYLNRVYFGSGAYGVEAAAQRYFGKSARQVTLAEAAVLAGLVKSPSRLAPTRNPDAAQRRAELVLTAMAETGAISAAAAKQAAANPAQTFKPGGAGSINYVADWIMDVLDDLVGRFEQDLVVETTIDPALQILAEKALVDELAQKGEKFDVGQGAIVAMTPEGAVRALVGGRNYAESQFNRAVAAKRQPGSAFKPFVYLTALERGLTPDTVREDKPIALKGWKPENYTREYFGNVSLTQALAHSLNTVSVRLTLEVGPQAVVRTAHRLGIASKLEPNASIALGTSEVSVIELVSAFAVLANGGTAVAPHVVERVRIMNGKTLYARQKSRLGQVVDPQHAGMMNTMMQETLLTGTARKAALPGWPAAGKTGTSQDFRDAWFIGYTSQLVTGVWLGNDDSSPTKKATGGGMPVEVWSRFMRSAHQGLAVAALPGAGGVRPGPAEAPMLPPGNIPAPQTVAAPGRGQPPASNLDGWFIDRLFGRR
jgi:penicillin-binding protein 1A